MKQLFFVLLTTIFTSFGFSQQLKWKVVTATPSYSISVAEMHYQNRKNDIDHQRLIFKYENKTDAPLELSFRRKVNYNGKTALQDRTFDIQLPAHSSKEYAASEKHDKLYFIYKKDNKGFISQTLTNFTIIQIKTTKL